jgi:hypothetical protein
MEMESVRLASVFVTVILLAQIAPLLNSLTLCNADIYAHLTKVSAN